MNPRGARGGQTGIARRRISIAARWRSCTKARAFAARARADYFAGIISIALIVGFSR